MITRFFSKLSKRGRPKGKWKVVVEEAMRGENDRWALPKDCHGITKLRERNVSEKKTITTG